MTPTTIDTKKCFDDLVYSSAPWKIYRQDAGMGEHDYAVFKNDVFFCRTDDSQAAHEIIRAIRFAANWENGERHDAEIIKAAQKDFAIVLTLLRKDILDYMTTGYDGSEDEKSEINRLFFERMKNISDGDPTTNGRGVGAE